MSAPTAGNCARFADTPIAGGGTPVEVWLGWQSEFPSLQLDHCPGLVVVAPHPDDETLGFGAAASEIAANGIDVHTVVASDGGAAWSDLSLDEQHRLEEARRRESRYAATLLGVPQPTFLGLPDGGLAAHERDLADALTDILAERAAGTWCAATWRGDGHPDHEAVGRAAAVAARRSGAVLLEYPVWMWHWARPADADVPWDRAARMASNSLAAQRKQRALTAFRTQFESHSADRAAILPPYVVARLRGVGEVVFR